jgi:hypothetical protein
VHLMFALPTICRNAFVAVLPHAQSRLSMRQDCLPSGASIPVRRISMSAIRMLSPSMTLAGPRTSSEKPAIKDQIPHQNSTQLVDQSSVQFNRMRLSSQ